MVRGTGSSIIYAGDGNNTPDSSAIYDVTFYSGAGNDIVNGSVGLGRFFIDVGGGVNAISASGGFRSTSIGVRAGSGNDKNFT